MPILTHTRRNRISVYALPAFVFALYSRAALQMIAVVTLQVAVSAFTIRTCSTRSRNPGSTDVFLKRGTCCRYEKSNPFINTGYSMSWIKVTWQYKYRILSEYCTIWLNIATWHYRYRILSDYRKMMWTIVTWKNGYQILNDCCTMWWTIVAW